MSINDDLVVLVTGASRGAGKGIALALAPGATVYVTGRSTAAQPGPDGLPGTVADTAAEIDSRGGRGIAVVCNHGDDRQVEDLFDRIGLEQGRLDVLVNNATALPDLPDSPRQGFWERPLADEVKPLDIGLRSHYVASHLGARMMAAAGRGLIAFTSSPGARTYLPGFHGPSYGAGKAGTDKMAFDMAQELRPHGVAVASIWMGVLRTERVEANFAADPKLAEERFPGIESRSTPGG
jgi:NAD(P)-dependent dehydrogenase (short-subunit alcohol dehydrogenase family)